MVGGGLAKGNYSFTAGTPLDDDAASEELHEELEADNDREKREFNDLDWEDA